MYIEEAYNDNTCRLACRGMSVLNFKRGVERVGDLFALVKTSLVDNHKEICCLKSPVVHTAEDLRVCITQLLLSQNIKIVKTLKLSLWLRYPYVSSNQMGCSSCRFFHALLSNMM